MPNPVRITKLQNIELRHNLSVRLRSIGYKRELIEKINFYIDVSCEDINQVAKDKQEIRKQYAPH